MESSTVDRAMPVNVKDKTISCISSSRCLIQFILTLLVSTVTTECAFSTMKMVKMRLHNKIYMDDFLLVHLSFKKEIDKTIDTDLVINEFESKKAH